MFVDPSLVWHGVALRGCMVQTDAAADASGSVPTVLVQVGGAGIFIGLAIGITLTVAFSRRVAVTESTDDLELEWDGNME